jgi:DNA-binding transcriptional ArsR family regulator
MNLPEFAVRNMREGEGKEMTSYELAKVIAEILGMSPETVEVHVRNLREAGHLSSKGRGRGAAQMTSRDATKLLVASAVSDFVRNSADAVDSVYKLRFYERSENKSMKAGNDARNRPNARLYRKIILNTLPAHVRMGEALEILIQAACEGKLFPELSADDFTKRIVPNNTQPRMTVSFQTTMKNGSFELRHGEIALLSAAYSFKSRYIGAFPLFQGNLVRTIELSSAVITELANVLQSTSKIST